jgi:hypothetical protein
MPLGSTHQIWVSVAGINNTTEESHQSGALIE